MEVINESTKLRLLEYIELNELDYNSVDNGITRFHIIAEDGTKFTIYTNENKFIVNKYDSKKDDGKPGSNPNEYYHFNTFSEVLEQLKYYDDNLYKRYWEPTLESIQIGFDKTNHIEDWYTNFIKDEFYTIEESSQYKYITYNNEGYNPELTSPFNTLHEVSDFNSMELTKVSRLHFEIHPISCLKKNESYYVKLLCNNDNTFKEYINYMVYKEKGLKLLIEQLFNDMEKFKL